MSAGVTNGTNVDRMNTLTASAPESTSNARKATAKLVVTPSTMVPTPKSATQASRTRPMRWLTGFHVRNSATTPAPIPVAARSQPSPTAPTPNRSSAMAGSNATAPPKSTAKRSSEIAPSRIGRLRTKRSPSIASCMPDWAVPSSRRAAAGRSYGRTCTVRIVTAAMTTSTTAVANGTHGAAT